MIPPWLKMATHWPAWAATMRSSAPRTRVRIDAADSAPGIASQRCSLMHLEGERVALGHVLAVELALPLAEVHLAQVALDDRFDAEAWRPAARRSGRCAAAT